MKKLLILAVILAATSAYAPALAGGCGGGGGGCGSGGGAAGSSEFTCSNQCPLAQTANKHRSLGCEAFSCSPAVRAKMTASVLGCLAKI